MIEVTAPIQGMKCDGTCERCGAALMAGVKRLREKVKESGAELPFDLGKMLIRIHMSEHEAEDKAKATYMLHEAAKVAAAKLPLDHDLALALAGFEAAFHIDGKGLN